MIGKKRLSKSEVRIRQKIDQKSWTPKSIRRIALLTCMGVCGGVYMLEDNVVEATDVSA